MVRENLDEAVLTCMAYQLLPKITSFFPQFDVE